MTSCNPHLSDRSSLNTKNQHFHQLLCSSKMASTIEDGHLYYVLSYGGTLTLDLSGGNSADNTRVIGWTPHFDQQARNRVWRFHSKGNSWQIINLASGTALTLRNGSSENGTEVVGSQPFDSDRQLWRFSSSQNNSQVTSWTCVYPYGYG